MSRAVKLARVAAGLVASASLVGGPAGFSEQALAQTSSTLAGVQGRALASGVAAAYRPEGLLPIASPVDLSSPDALATIASGPSTFARASVADPGDLLANPDALLALGSPDWQPGTLPPYPYRVSASSSVGEPTAESNPAPGLNARVGADASGSSAQATMPALSAPAIATAGSIASLASTTIVGSTATVYARVEVSNFDVLGIVTIESVVTELTATADGATTAVAGGTTVTGATVLGQPVTIDSGGVHGQPPSTASKPLLGDVVGSGGGSVDELLAAAGIRISLAGPVVQDGENSSQLTAAGLHIEVELSDQTVPVLRQIADLVPPTDAPGVEDAIALALVRHLQYIDIARGFVSLTARQAAPAPPPVTPTRAASSPAPASSGAGSLVGAPPPRSTPIVGTGSPAGPAATEPVSTRTLASGIGALAVLALLAQPVVGRWLARFPAALLGPGTAGHCPREER